MKKLHHSKTFWLNLSLALASAAMLVDAELLSQLGIEGKVQLIVLKWCGIIAAIYNLYLRLKTKEGIELPKLKK